MRKFIVTVVLASTSMLVATMIGPASASTATQVTVDGVTFTTYSTTVVNGTTYYAVPSSTVNQELVKAGATTTQLSGQNPSWWWVAAPAASTPATTTGGTQVTVDGVTFTTYSTTVVNGTTYYAVPSSAVTQQLTQAGATTTQLSGQNPSWWWVAASASGSTAASVPSASGGGIPAGYTHAIFSDNFANLDQWNTFITDRNANGYPWNTDGDGGSGLAPGDLNAEYFEPSHDFLTSQGLVLQATAGSTRPGYWWTSGAVSSYNHFEFEGGYVQITAKMPDTTAGAWPSLWLLAGPGATTSREIDMFEGGMTGYGPVDDTYAFHVQPGSVGGQTDTGVNMSAGFNTYGMAWVPGSSVTYYLDGKEVGEVTSSETSIPTNPMELVMSLDMATGATSSWHTVSGNSGTYDMTIQSVNVYQ